MPEIKSYENAIMAEQPILASIRRTEGEAPAIAMLMKILSEFVRFFTVGKGMNQEQIIETAKLFYSEFYFLKLSDLKLFFSQMKTGYYGQIYDRIDGNVIFTNLRTYCEARMNCAETLSLEKHKELLALDGEDKYIFSCGNEFIIQIDNEFGIISERESATTYTFSEALEIKKFLLKNYITDGDSEIKIERPLKPAQSLIEYFAQNKPELAKELSKKNIERDKKKKLQHELNLIDANVALSDFERTNKRRELLGLLPLNEIEFEKEKVK